MHLQMLGRDVKSAHPQQCINGNAHSLCVKVQCGQCGKRRSSKDARFTMPIDAELAGDLNPTGDVFTKASKQCSYMAEGHLVYVDNLYRIAHMPETPGECAPHTMVSTCWVHLSHC